MHFKDVLEDTKMYLIIFLIALSFNGQGYCQQDEKLSIEDLFTSSKLIEGKKFTITCQVLSSLDDLNFEWYLNGKKLSQNENLLISSFEKDNSVLSIKSMSFNYSGEYTCKVENSLKQQDTRSIHLNLNGK